MSLLLQATGIKVKTASIHLWKKWSNTTFAFYAYFSVWHLIKIKSLTTSESLLLLTSAHATSRIQPLWSTEASESELRLWCECEHVFGLVRSVGITDCARFCVQSCALHVFPAFPASPAPSTLLGCFRQAVESYLTTSAALRQAALRKLLFHCGTRSVPVAGLCSQPSYLLVIALATSGHGNWPGTTATLLSV